ncbi:hypothetical protein IEQ44_05100 [Nocardioides sp. Y6]|uniref:Imelysin-like domain-containing protein n=1 Tax=Nocardioides malaquae TaxID=2773426 RepID=A0ABR9RR29_9ACTN|nr:hypothetical protein [Nocardioides malaquae]MBE7324026.1 hypothetical protein [Nocardioides malaquae]
MNSRPGIVRLGLLSSLLVLSACGGVTTPDAADDDKRHLLAAVSDDAATAMAKVQRDFDRWAGDPTTHQAAAVVQAHWLNGPQDECLDQASLPFEAWPGWEVAIGPVTVPLWYTDAAVLPPVPLLSHEPRLNAPSDRLDDLQRRVPPKEYRRAIDACSEEGDVGSESELRQFTAPAAATRLTKAWEDAVKDGVSVADTEDSITACASKKELPAPLNLPAGPSLDTWFTTVDQLRPDPDDIPLVEGEEPSDAWADYTAAEAALLIAVWECHEDTFDQAMEQLIKISDEFARTHADDIAEAAAAWQRTRERATELGWSPDRPLAGFPLNKL